MLFQCGSCPLGWVNQAFSGSPACHASWHPVTACINTRPLVIIIAAMNSLKEIVFHEAARLDGISDAFSFLSLSSSRVAGMAISWCNIVLSVDNMNTYCFGQMELALPLHLDLAFFRKPVGNKGLNRPKKGGQNDLTEKSCTFSSGSSTISPILLLFTPHMYTSEGYYLMLSACSEVLQCES